MSSFWFLSLYARYSLTHVLVSFVFKHSQEFVDSEMCICIKNLVFKRFWCCPNSEMCIYIKNLVFKRFSCCPNRSFVHSPFEYKIIRCYTFLYELFPIRWDKWYQVKQGQWKRQRIWVPGLAREMGRTTNLTMIFSWFVDILPCKKISYYNITILNRLWVKYMLFSLNFA